MQITDLPLRPEAARIEQLLGALDHPHSFYAALPAADKTRLKAEVLAYAKRHSIRVRLKAGKRAPRPLVEQGELDVPGMVADLFEDLERWPRRPYCSDDKTARYIRSLPQALKRSYIQANPPHLRVWSIYDVDRAGGALAWEAAGLPPPSWASANRENGHAHLVWGLSAPVLVEADDARRAPMRYLAAVESAFRSALEADAGFGGLITKNPAHPLWHTLRGPRLAYALGDLAQAVELPKHMPKRKPEEVGLGRNVTLFDSLRRYAYQAIRTYRKDVRNFVLWQSHLNTKALERNGDFIRPMDGREVWHIAKSVSKWVWHQFDIESSDQRFSELQRHRVEQRWGDNEAKRASARLMAAQGMGVRAIARELTVDPGTVSRWLKDSASN